MSEYNNINMTYFMCKFIIMTKINTMLNKIGRYIYADGGKEHDN